MVNYRVSLGVMGDSHIYMDFIENPPTMIQNMVKSCIPIDWYFDSTKSMGNTIVVTLPVDRIMSVGNIADFIVNTKKIFNPKGNNAIEVSNFNGQMLKQMLEQRGLRVKFNRYP